MPKKKSKAGRPRKAVKEINRQIQFGRRPEADIELVDAAAKKRKMDRAAWAWGTMLDAARRELEKE